MPASFCQLSLGLASVVFGERTRLKITATLGGCEVVQTFSYSKCQDSVTNLRRCSPLDVRNHDPSMTSDGRCMSRARQLPAVLSDFKPIQRQRTFSLTFFLISFSGHMITCHTGELSQSMNTLACTVKQKELLLCAQLITGSSESIEEVQGGKHRYYYC